MTDIDTIKNIDHAIRWPRKFLVLGIESYGKTLTSRLQKLSLKNVEITEAHFLGRDVLFDKLEDLDVIFIAMSCRSIADLKFVKEWVPAACKRRILTIGISDDWNTSEAKSIPGLKDSFDSWITALETNPALITDGSDTQLNPEVSAVRLLLSIANEHHVMCNDLEDARIVLGSAGEAFIGVGLGSGENGPLDAAKATLQDLRGEVRDLSSIAGACFILHFSPDNFVSLQKSNESFDLMQRSFSDNCNFIFAYGDDDSLGDQIRATLLVNME